MLIIYCLVSDGVTSQPRSTSRRQPGYNNSLSHTLYHSVRRPHAHFTDTSDRSAANLATPTRNLDGGSTPRRCSWRSAALGGASSRDRDTGGNDEFTACRRGRSKALRISLGNAPVKGFTQQISGKWARSSTTRPRQCHHGATGGSDCPALPWKVNSLKGRAVNWLHFAIQV